VIWGAAAAYVLLAVTHTGVRVARKTYVVDTPSGDRRAEYVAVSNTVMGVLLLVAGAVSGDFAQLDTRVALALLAGLSVIGVRVGQSLPDVSKAEVA
jgi:hypothetical protein